jgi:presenilin-like A22 family membrane protease
MVYKRRIMEEVLKVLSELFWFYVKITFYVLAIIFSSNRIRQWRMSPLPFESAITIPIIMTVYIVLMKIPAKPKYLATLIIWGVSLGIGYLLNKFLPWFDRYIEERFGKR